MQVFGCAEMVSEYLKSAKGHRRLHALAKGFRYGAFDTQIRSGASVANEIAYVIASQLTRVRHPTQSAMNEYLRNNRGFQEDALFQVWIIHKALYHEEEGHIAVPLIDLPYRVLHRLVPPAEWKRVQDQLVKCTQRLAVGAAVPLCWWHTAEQDAKYGIHRQAGAVDGRPMSSILNIH